jgi:hypothetical protein
MSSDIVDWLIAYDLHPSRDQHRSSRLVEAADEIVSLRQSLLEAQHRLRTISETAST